jgi:hypothetical protein
MSADTTAPAAPPALSADPAFPANCYGAKQIAYSGAARGSRTMGAIVAYDSAPGLDTRDMSPEQRAVRTAAIALLKAVSVCQCGVDSVILSVLAAAATEADDVKADRDVVRSVQVKKAAAAASDGEYRTRKAGKK